MTLGPDLQRRRLLTGAFDTARSATGIHISSAVVLAFPHRSEEVARRIGALPGVEVRHVQNGKIVVVIEGDGGKIGERLLEMATLDGVLAANLVFEQFVPFDIAGTMS